MAIQSYLSLLQDTNDNNVKLIVLNKIAQLQERHPKLLEDHIIELLTAVEGSDSSEISKTALTLATELASTRNIKDIVMQIEKDLKRVRSTEVTVEYQFLLIKAIASLAERFPATLPSLLGPLITTFLPLAQKNAMPALESVLFVREVIETYPEHREVVF